jgi:hypothetical protein
MKKLISLLMATLMIAALFAGCSLGKDSGKGDTETKKELSRGTIEGAVYKNDFTGIQFTRPDSWVYSTDEEIAYAMSLGAEFLEGDLKKALENSPTVYDMLVTDTLTRTNINVGFENLAKTLATNISEEQYFEAMKKQLDNVTGMTVSFPEKYDTVKLGGNDYLRAVCNVSAMGVNMQQVYYVRKVDKYMSFVIVTIVSGYTVQDIEAMFN